MTLKSMVTSHDSMALETLTSKGLLRRAQRVLESGLGKIESVDENKAIIMVGEESVTIDGKGPLASSCTCKAHGLCRHILVAILLLRDHLPDENKKEAESEPFNAMTELCSLTDEQIITFAGADWSKSLSLITGDLQFSIHEEGPTVSVRMVELDSSVTFIAGNGLKGAAFKGPKTRKRLLTTVAALVVRQKEGLHDPEASLIATTVAGINSDFIDKAQQTIEQAVSATLLSRSALGQDLFLDLAISSRCEALPRLSAELRALANQSQNANKRSTDFEPSAFFLDASRSYALLEALRRNSSDQLLTGSVRRDFEKVDAMEVWPLGVSRWRSRTGARGLSAYALDPESCQWRSIREGRGAGTELSFNISTTYKTFAWGESTLSGLMGRRVQIPEPSMSKDGSLSAKSQKGSKVLEKSLMLDQILKSDAAHREWRTLKKDLQSRMGSGIRRRQTALPAIIIPTSFGRFGFDDMNQFYSYEVRDRFGESLILNIPDEDDETAVRLWKMEKEVKAMVVESSLGKDGLEVRPVSVLLLNHSGVSVHNLDFDDWKIESGIRKMISKFRECVAKPLITSQFDETNPINQAVSDTVDELINLISSSAVKNTASLLRRLEASGLVTLAEALEKVSRSADLRSALKAGFIASEIRAMLMMV